jgi:ABC-type multidrug transport system fused ATPase/permease subunit
MCSYAEETLSNIRTVKAFADEKQCLAKYNSESMKVYEWANKMAKLWGFFMAQLQILGAGSLAIVCFSASVFYQQNDISIGTITAFLLYMRSFQELSMNITNNLQAIVKIHGAAYDISVLIVAPNKVVHDGKKVIGEETEEEDKEHPVLAMEKVEFNYPTKPDVKVLKGVSIDVLQN